MRCSHLPRGQSWPRLRLGGSVAGPGCHTGTRRRDTHGDGHDRPVRGCEGTWWVLELARPWPGHLVMSSGKERWLFSESCASCLGRVLSAVLTLISITCTVSQGCESFCHMLLPRASLLWMHQPARCHQMARAVCGLRRAKRALFTADLAAPFHFLDRSLPLKLYLHPARRCFGQTWCLLLQPKRRMCLALPRRGFVNRDSHPLQDRGTPVWQGHLTPRFMYTGISTAHTERRLLYTPSHGLTKVSIHLCQHSCPFGKHTKI